MTTLSGTNFVQSPLFRITSLTIDDEIYEVLAADYIWKKFKTVWISEQAQNIAYDVEVIQKGLAHKPFNSESKAHQKFQKTLQEKMASLRAKLPQITF